MNRINILDEAVASRIAAGEVVVNPAAVIKELLENAIDAGSSAVTIEIVEGGKQMIRVTDNGAGIHTEDVPLAIQKHATSKIAGMKDLSSIATLGFRGEALASMAAVSRLTISTRVHDSIAGTVLNVNGGDAPDVSAAGLPEGTTVKVENLFYNVPARKKFLKTTAHETAAITSIVSKTLLSNPEIAFKYINNGKLIYQSMGNGVQKDALITVFGRDIKDKITPVEYDYGNIKINGYISKPAFLYKSSNNLIFFLNGRYIQSKNLQAALMRGYGERVLRSHYPFAVLNIELPYDLVDVNVHPNKLQVMFFNEAVMLDSLSRAVSSALKENAPPVISGERFKSAPLRGDAIQTISSVIKGIEIAPLRSPVSKLPDLKSAEKLYRTTRHVADSSGGVVNYGVDGDVFKPQQTFENIMEEIIEQAAEQPESVQTDIPDVRTMVDFTSIGQVFSTYLLCECGNVLYLIDQHAAHERITYENMKEEIERGSVFSQQLLIPVVRKFGQRDFDLLAKHHDLLFELGFDYEEFGPLTYKFSAFPVQIDKSNADSLIDDILHEISTRPGDIVLLREQVIRASCRHSIKAGYRLSDDQISNLIADIVKMDAIPTCPHGRPIALALTKEELQKGFKRTV